VLNRCRTLGLPIMPPVPISFHTSLILLGYVSPAVTERDGFHLPSFCNLIKNLYLALNSNKNKDLYSLVSLLSSHDFLLS
jgi:hypothetical protein